MAMKRLLILVIDDEPRILNFISQQLMASGYSVATADNGFEALKRVRTEEPDLVVLDLLMPKMNGWETLKQLRKFSMVPVIILSAKGSDVDKVRGLDLGADDYLAKPFSSDELIARIEAIKRRVEPAQRRVILSSYRFGDVNIDFEKHTVTVSGEDKYLTRVEWLLLTELTYHAGRLLTYEELLSRVWGPEYREETHLLRAWISRLRNKLADFQEPKMIRTIPKIGFIMAPSWV